MTDEKTYPKLVLTGVDIPFGELVKLMIKLSLASIPAAIIFSALTVVVGILLTFLFAFLGYGVW